MMVATPMFKHWLSLSNDPVPVGNTSCVATILDIPTHPVPLYSPSSPLLNDSNYICLVALSLKLAHLAMLFIDQLTHTAAHCQQCVLTDQ